MIIGQFGDYDWNKQLIPRSHWHLKPPVVFLNHGSFGACPKETLSFQHQLQIELESEPVDFLLRSLEPAFDSNRARLAEFIGARPEAIGFVPNATTGVNAVLRSIDFHHDGNFVSTSHVYNACGNAMEYIARRRGIEIRYPLLDFPSQDPSMWIESLAAAIDHETQFVLLDHITSTTAVIFPIEEMIPQIRQTAPDALIMIDGAHVPGQIPLNLENLDVDFYTGNLHKWMMTPKGAGFLYVPSARRRLSIHPVVISHGANSNRSDRSRFLLEFDWTGTTDPTAILCISPALEFVNKHVPGGWNELMLRNHQLALLARQEIANHFQIPIPCPNDQIPSMAALPLPTAFRDLGTVGVQKLPALQEWLRSQHQIEVPVPAIRDGLHDFIRISAQAYNCLDDYSRLIKALDLAQEFFKHS